MRQSESTFGNVCNIFAKIYIHSGRIILIIIIFLPHYWYFVMFLDFICEENIDLGAFVPTFIVFLTGGHLMFAAINV